MNNGQKHSKKSKSKLVIDRKLIDLVKFFISSNIAVQALSSKHLRRALSFKLSRRSFKKKVLPDLLTVVYKELDTKLISAASITLITDIWSSCTRFLLFENKTYKN